MKKTLLILAVTSMVILTAGVFVVNPTYASGGDEFAPGGPGGGMMGPAGKGGGSLGTYMTKAWAETLGMKEDELQARLDSGERIYDIAIKAGWKAEDFSTKMEEVRNKAIDLALADGAITQTQADWMRQKMSQNGGSFRRGGTGSWMNSGGLRNGDGFLHDEMVAAMAGVFGMSTTDLEAALKEGKNMMDIAADKGMSIADFRTKMTDAMTKAINQAVSKGLITKEQGDFMLERMQQRGNRGGRFAPQSGTPQPNKTPTSNG